MLPSEINRRFRRPDPYGNIQPSTDGKAVPAFAQLAGAHVPSQQNSPSNRHRQVVAEHAPAAPQPSCSTVLQRTMLGELHFRARQEAERRKAAKARSNETSNEDAQLGKMSTSDRLAVLRKRIGGESAFVVAEFEERRSEERQRQSQQNLVRLEGPPFSYFTGTQEFAAPQK